MKAQRNVSLIALFLLGFVFASVAKAAAETPAESARPDKKFSVVAQPIGYGPNPTASAGIAAGYFLDSSSIILFELMGNLFDTSYNDLYASRRITRSGRSFGVHYKHFLWNSFYVKGGVDHRTYDYESNDEFYSYGFKSSSETLSIAIGNQWQWRYFTLGCDWVGYVQPFHSEFHDEHDNSAGVGSSYNLDVERQKTKDGTSQGLRLYLGASF